MLLGGPGSNEHGSPLKAGQSAARGHPGAWWWTLRSVDRGGTASLLACPEDSEVVGAVVMGPVLAGRVTGSTCAVDLLHVPRLDPWLTATLCHGHDRTLISPPVGP
jgi:hypothetical protein